LDRFDFIAGNDEDLDDIRRRYMLQTIIYRLEEERYPAEEEDEEEEISPDEDLLREAREVMEKFAENPDEGMEIADEILRFREDHFVLHYFGTGEDDDEPTPG